MLDPADARPRSSPPFRTCRICSRSRSWTSSRRARMRPRSSVTRRAAFAISPGSPPARPKCGATSRSRTAMRSWARSTRIARELDRIAAMVAAGDGTALEAVFARASVARREWGARFGQGPAVAADGPREARSRAWMHNADDRLARPRADVARRGRGRASRTRRASPIARCCWRRSRPATRDSRDCSTPTTSTGCRTRSATLGIEVDAVPGTRDVVVHGQGGDIPVKSARLQLGNAGTALRPLTAVLALAGGHYELSGVARMHERPIGDLVDALRPLGADIRYLGNPAFRRSRSVPDSVHAAGARDRVTVRGDVSSQFTSALLMALPTVTARGGRALARRHRRRVDLEAVRRDHHPSHGALRCHRRAGRMAIVSRAGRAPAMRVRARCTWKATRRRPRTFLRRARSAAVRSASPASAVIRSRATSRSPDALARMGARIDARRRLDRGALGAGAERR